MSPGAVLLIVEATLDAAMAGLPTPEARLEAVLPILVRATVRGGRLLRDSRPEITWGEAVAQLLDCVEDEATNRPPELARLPAPVDDERPIR